MRLRNDLWAISIVLLVGCGGDDSEPVSSAGNQGTGNTGGKNPVDLSIWSIPKNEVFDGGPGKDGIPALENPAMITANEATYLAENDLVVGVKMGNDVRAYPHPILDWHEIINDKVGTTDLAVIYCPLTGTATAWGRTFNGTTTTFGVSGLLYNTNVIPYDRATDSHWSQMRLDCVNGLLREEKAETFHSVETTWKTWKKMYPTTKVVSLQTGFARSYGVYPYGDYKTNNNKILFPYSPVDNRLPNKERVLGLVAPGSTVLAKAYRFGNFDAPISVKHDNFFGLQIVLAGSTTNNFLVAFESKTQDGSSLTLSAADFSQGATASILQDTEGNTWNIFGEAISGPRTGQKLKPLTGFIGYWFSWASFYPGIEIGQPQ